MDKQTSQIYFPNGVNAAPIKPLLDLKDSTIPEKQVQDHYLVKQLRDKYTELINDRKQSWREMICAGQINALFIEGEQILKINNFSGMPSVIKPDKTDPLHIKCINDMQFYSTTWQDKWQTSKQDTIVSPFSNADQAIAQARKANAVVDYLENELFSNWFDLHEGLNAQVWGWYGRRVRPDFTSKSYATFKEIIGEREVPIGKAYGKCDSCGYKGNDSKPQAVGKNKFDACPKCDSLEYDFEPPIMRVMPQVVGKEKIFLPKIICEPLLFPSVRFDLSCRAEVSGWFIVEKKISENALRRIIGQIRFPEGGSENDFGLDAIDFLSSRGAAMDGRSDVSKEKTNRKRITLTEMYLSADELYDIRIGGEEKTVEGGMLPKGKRMSDVFPDGCCIIGINGMALILGIYAESHKESITTGVYHLKSMSGAGRGVTDATEVAKQKNRRYSQIDANFATRGTPALLTPENAIEQKYKRLLNTPGAIIPVKLQNFPEIKDVRALIAPLQGADMDGNLVDYTFSRLNDMMQTAYHITTLGGAKPRGINNNTATFAEIVDSNSDAIFSPVLSIKADVGVETIRKAFYQWVKFTPEARFIPFKQSQKSGTIGIEIKGEDVDAEYNWSYVPGSEAPKSRHTETQKRMGFFSMFAGGIAEYFQIKEMKPAEMAEIERDFDVNFETDSFDTVGESCRLRFERAKEMLNEQEKAGMAMPDNLSILAELEPLMLITEASLPEKALWFQNLLDTEEGLRMGNEMRELVSTFVLAFKELAKGQTIQIQRDLAEIQVAAQEPIMEAQMAQEAQQAQMVQENEQGAQGEQMAAEAMQTMAQNAENEQQRAHEGEQAEMQAAQTAESEDNDAAMRTVEMLNEQQMQAQQHQHDQDLAKKQASKK